MLKILLKFNAFIASSWALSGACRLHGVRLTGRLARKSGTSPMAPICTTSAFRERRGMCPREWLPGRVRGYRLRFNLKLRHSGKAVFANLCAAEVWGVLYKITRRNLVL